MHIADGAWAGADNGDPQFKKWLGDPNPSGWSPDRNSWAVLTAAKNRVYTAEDIQPITNLHNVINVSGNATEKAWGYLVQAQSSDYWYWDGTEIWDSDVTRGSNLAVTQANQVLTTTALANEKTPPSVFVPQRSSYNPGDIEWGTTPQPSDFKVWTYAYDVSGLASVTLKWRTDKDGANPLDSTQNETYVGGAEVNAWSSLAMGSSDVTPPANITAAQYRALQYSAMITGQTNKLIDYYVEAVDAKGNITRTDIQHVWVGAGGGTTPTDPTLPWTMDGTLDATAKTLATNGGMKLSWDFADGKLYVATNDAGEGNDHFIYLAGTPGALRGELGEGGAGRRVERVSRRRERQHLQRLVRRAGQQRQRHRHERRRAGRVDRPGRPVRRCHSGRGLPRGGPVRVTRRRHVPACQFSPPDRQRRWQPQRQRVHQADSSATGMGRQRHGRLVDEGRLDADHCPQRRHDDRQVPQPRQWVGHDYARSGRHA
ncbi:MAG: hypothetical protein QM770_22430 [Tepidisphaeraceae bacterium]